MMTYCKTRLQPLWWNLHTGVHSDILKTLHSTKMEKLYLSFKLEYRTIWTASSEFGTYRLCEQRRFRRTCASAQSPQNLRCSLVQAVSQEEPSDRKPDSWPLWMAWHAQLKFVMTECSKTQIRLTRPICTCKPAVLQKFRNGTYSIYLSDLIWPFFNQTEANKYSADISAYEL